MVEFANLLWVYGGATAFNLFDNNAPQACMQTDQRVYSFSLSEDGKKGFWKEYPFATIIPPGRAFHSAIMDEARSQMVVFGGLTDDCVVLSDIWAFNVQGEISWKKL